MRGFIEELRRRNVFHVGVAYVVTGWLIVQVADIAAVREFYYALEPHMSGFYTNLHDDDNVEKKVWGNYGPNYPRLVDIKNQYDPTNLFRLNANIKPTV